MMADTAFFALAQSFFETFKTNLRSNHHKVQSCFARATEILAGKRKKCGNSIGFSTCEKKLFGI